MAVDIKGRKRLNDKLKRLRTQTAGAMKPGLAQAAEIVTGEQKRLVPVRTGALRDSIQWTFGTPPAYSSLGRLPRGERSENATRVTITAGNTRVRYAHLVEFGWTKGKAQAFFYPGYRATKKRAAAMIQKAAKAAVKKAASG